MKNQKTDLWIYVIILAVLLSIFISCGTPKKMTEAQIIEQLEKYKKVNDFEN